jgi:TolB-like protein/class 3 adenylate cyclase
MASKADLTRRSNQSTESAPIVRRLAAIVFADVADFSKMVERNDIGTMERWRALRREVIDSKTSEHRGRLIQLIGDELFLEFRSAVDAARWAMDVQRALRKRNENEPQPIQMRIGINIEDAIVDKEGLHGDGINIASRIQRLARPGETVITAAVREFIWNKIGAGLIDLGPRHLKNISHPVRLYRLEEGFTVEPKYTPHLDWSYRPSIAVMPFRNSGGDQQEAYFGEGITEDIIAGLARGRSFFVIARTSTLPYRDRTIDARQIASELGVRYIVDGSVRRDGSRLRIGAQLIEGDTNQTIWGDRYDGPLEALFDFQDQISTRIVATVQPQLMNAETARAHAKPTESLDAYDCVLRALALLYSLRDDELQKAGDYFRRATELDQRYAQAYAYKAWWYGFLFGQRRSANLVQDLIDADEAASTAMRLDPNDPFVVAIAGYAEAFFRRNPDNAAQLFDRALKLNDSSALAWGASAIPLCYLGEPERALDHLRSAWRLSPFDPLTFMFDAVAGFAEFLAGRYEEAIIYSQRACRENARYIAAHRTLAAAFALAGRSTEAHAVAGQVLALEPNFRVSTFLDGYPLRRRDDVQRMRQALGAAGFPE